MLSQRTCSQHQGPAMAAVEAAPRVGAPVLDHVTISLQGGSDTALAQMLSVCKQALPGWADVSEQDVEVRAIVIAHVGD